jgi:hypothetical protein
MEMAPEHSGAMPCWIIFAMGVRTDMGCTLLIAGEARPRRLHAVDQCVICQKIGGKQSPVTSAFMEQYGGEPFGEFDGTVSWPILTTMRGAGENVTMLQKEVLKPYRQRKCSPENQG